MWERKKDALSLVQAVLLSFVDTLSQFNLMHISLHCQARPKPSPPNGVQEFITFWWVLSSQMDSLDGIPLWEKAQNNLRHPIAIIPWHRLHYTESTGTSSSCQFKPQAGSISSWAFSIFLVLQSKCILCKPF